MWGMRWQGHGGRQSQHNEPALHSPPKLSSLNVTDSLIWGDTVEKASVITCGRGHLTGRRKTVHPRSPTPSGWRSTSYKSSFPSFRATHVCRDAEVYSWAAGEGQPDGTCKKAELEPETGRVQGDPAESDPSHSPGLEKYMWFLQLLKAKSRTPLNSSTIC